jgi:ribosomal protein S27E
MRRKIMPSESYPWRGKFSPVLKTRNDQRTDRYLNLKCPECRNARADSYLEVSFDGIRTVVFCNGCACTWRVFWETPEAIKEEKRARRQAMYGPNRLSLMPKKEK